MGVFFLSWVNSNASRTPHEQNIVSLLFPIGCFVCPHVKVIQKSVGETTQNTETEQRKKKRKRARRQGEIKRYIHLINISTGRTNENVENVQCAVYST